MSDHTLKNYSRSSGEIEDTDTINMQRGTFVEGMSRAVASVSIVTINNDTGRDGVSVSSITSVSADPPAMLICINNEATSVAPIRQNGVFCINLLRDNQAGLSNVSASLVDALGNAEFSLGNWEASATGKPRLPMR